MATTKVERVLREIESLTPEERRKVSERLSALAGEPPVQNGAADAVYRQMLAEGMLVRAPAGRAQRRRKQKRALIRIKGKPLSQTIIEERR
jgi:hypothetical protein